MDVFQENLDQPKYGNYRAQIIEVNTTVKNGIYKVKVYPFMANIQDIHLPWAQSNMTVNGKHVCLDEDEWVWIFFEGGDVHYPVIFDRCNIKDNYPDDAKGQQPSWYSKITPASQIGESSVSYGGQYNSVDSFDFGDDIHLEFDKENKQFILLIGDNYFVIDKAGDLHIKAGNEYHNITTAFNVAMQKFKLLTTATDEISIDETGKVVIKGGATPMAIYNQLTSLQALLQDILTAFSTQVQSGNLGLPISWTSNAKQVEGIIKLAQLLSAS